MARPEPRGLWGTCEKQTLVALVWTPGPWNRLSFLRRSSVCWSRMFMSVWYAKKMGSRFLHKVRRSRKHRHRKMVRVRLCYFDHVKAAFRSGCGHRGPWWGVLLQWTWEIKPSNTHVLLLRLMEWDTTACVLLYTVHLNWHGKVVKMLCFVLFFFNLTRAVLVHKYTSTQGCYYTDILVHWDTSTQRYWYTGMLENRDTSTQRNQHSGILVHRDVSIQGYWYTEILVHRDAGTQRY